LALLRRKKMKKKILSIIFLFISISLISMEVRLKDISTFEGVRDNELIGYGIVVGLNGTGDTTQNKFTFQAIANMLDKMGVTVDPKQFQLRNVASVMVTGKLPMFARSGSKIDVTVSSMGSAKSIQGGILLMTPLKAANGQVYAVAQGPVSIGGYNEGGGGGNVRKNHPTVGIIPGGGIVEKEVPFAFSKEGYLNLLLYNPDFTTATRVAERINSVLGLKSAKALDSSTIRVDVPPSFQGKTVKLASIIENISITPDSKAVIIINERTGTIVFGENAKISKVAIAHGSLTVAIQTQQFASQPPPMSGGQTVVMENQKTDVTEEQASFMMMEGPTVGDLIKALNSIGATPRDIIAILEAIKRAGAINAELKII
jgi:flagellar P-ring protein precursor FlgI